MKRRRDVQCTFSTLTVLWRTFSTMTVESFHDDSVPFSCLTLILFHAYNRRHIPSVVNIPGLLKIVEDGQYLTVDGSQGHIVLEEGSKKLD